MHGTIEAIVHVARCRETDEKTNAVWPSSIIEERVPDELVRFLRVPSYQ